MSFYKRLKYQKCHELDSLTFIEQDKNFTNHLMINQALKQKYLTWYQNEIEVRTLKGLWERNLN